MGRWTSDRTIIDQITNYSWTLEQSRIKELKRRDKKEKKCDSTTGFRGLNHEMKRRLLGSFSI